jgi:hypothetical protein
MMVGFPHYTYPAALPLLGAAVKLGMFPMPGVGEVPKEGMAALQSELTNAGDVEQYARKEYGAVSLADAVRKLCGCSRGLTRPAHHEGKLPHRPWEGRGRFRVDSRNHFGSATIRELRSFAMKRGCLN